MQQNKGGEQKLSKLFGLFSLILIINVTNVKAESFQEFVRSQSESFSKYKDERDSEFNNYLKQEWLAYKDQQGISLYEKPKPSKIPKTALRPIDSVGPKVNIKVVKKIPQKVVVNEVVETKKQDEVEKQVFKKESNVVSVIEEKDIKIEFFGSDYGFNIPLGMKEANFYPKTKDGVSNFFDSSAGSEYEDLVKEIKKLKSSLNLNDWALYLLVNRISSAVHTNYDNASLMSWFIFNKLGYAVKVGLANKHVVLMYYSKKDIYSTPSYSFDNKNFYVIANYNKSGVGRLYSYPQNYPDANKAIDLSLKELPKFKRDIKYKDLSFVENAKKYEIGFNYNKNIIDFMATYPQADYDTYFNAPLDRETFEFIATRLKEFIDGKKMSEAINFVLHFVQKSFNYQRDDEQFGREKVMFAQETLYYDSSDCEDRAVLFSKLVSSLFNIGVVGVKYKDHMSTGLYIPMDGDTIKANSRRFVIADPTYINANIGQNMPKYKSLKPQKFIVVKRDKS